MWSVLGLACAVGAVAILPWPATSQAPGFDQHIAQGDDALQGGDARSAAEHFEAAVALSTSFGEDDVRRVTGLSRLALAYRRQGDFAKPEQLYRQALGLASSSLSSDPVQYGELLNEIGRYFHARRKYTDAGTYYRDAFALRTRALGRDHPDVAESINNLAVLFENEARYDKADVYYKTALDIRERALGVEHEKTIQSLEHYARLLGKINQAAASAPLRERSEAYRQGLIADTLASDAAVAAPDVTPPKLERRSEPEYTEEARIARHEGEVVLETVIGTDGTAKDFRLIRSLGLGLDEQAVRAVREWQFAPARRGKQPVPYRTSLRIRFRLL